MHTQINYLDNNHSEVKEKSELEEHSVLIHHLEKDYNSNDVRS